MWYIVTNFGIIGTLCIQTTNAMIQTAILRICVAVLEFLLLLQDFDKCY